MVYWISRCKSVTAALVMEPQLAPEIDPHPEIPANGSCQHMESVDQDAQGVGASVCQHSLEALD
jgi:hypothetical protein